MPPARPALVVVLVVVLGRGALAAPQEEQAGLGGLLRAAGQALDQNKEDIVSALGLAGEGEEQAGLLDTVLKKLKLDPAMITSLTSSVTSQEGAAKVLAALSSPASLPAVLKEQTGLSSEAVDSTVASIRQALRSVSSSSGGLTACTAVVILMLAIGG